MQSNVVQLSRGFKNSKAKAMAISDAENSLRLALAYLQGGDVNLTAALNKAVAACVVLAKAQLLLENETPPL